MTSLLILICLLQGQQNDPLLRKPPQSTDVPALGAIPELNSVRIPSKEDFNEAYEASLLAAAHRFTERKWDDEDFLIPLLIKHPKFINQPMKYIYPRKPSGGEEFLLIHRAAMHDNIPVAKYLLKHGADVNSKTYDGTTPIFLAVKHGKNEMAAFLIEKGADVNGKTTTLYWEPDWTPLHFAARNGNLEMVRLLLKNGAKIDAKSKEIPKGTPLPAQPGLPVMMKGMLERRNVVEMTIPSKTAIDIAREYNRSEMEKYLLQEIRNSKNTEPNRPAKP
jgi:hypothetical protein